MDSYGDDVNQSMAWSKLMYYTKINIVYQKKILYYSIYSITKSLCLSIKSCINFKNIVLIS